MMNTMHFRLTKMFFCLFAPIGVLAFISTGNALGGQKPHTDLFKAIPEAARKDFIDHIALIVAFRRSRQFDKLYDLLAPDYTQSETKSMYVKRLNEYYSKGDSFRKFRIDEIVPRREEGRDTLWVGVWGCLEEIENGKVRRVYAMIDAHLDYGKWYFSDIGLVRTFGENSEPCRNAGSGRLRRRAKSVSRDPSR